MEGKKKYFALVLFLFLGLMIFTFANPVEEEKEFKDGNNEQSEKVNNKKEDKDNNGQDQQNVQNDVTNTNTNNNNAQAQNQQDDSLAKAEAAVQLAEGTYSQEDVDAAKELVNKVTDTTEKGKLEDRLAEVEAGIEVLALLENLETQVDEAEQKEDMTNATSYRDENAIATKIEALKNEEVKEALQERLDTVSKLLDDNKAPIANVEAKAYNKDQVITAEDEAGNEFTMYLAKGTGEETKIENGTETTGDGIYTLRLVDEAFNETTIQFVVDTTDPILKGLKNGNHYDEVKIDVEDLTDVVIKVTNMDKSQTTEVENGTVLTEEATYKIEVTDEAGNKTSYYVAIDKTAPTISGVTNNSYVNKSENAYIRDKFLTLVRVTAKYANGTEKVEEFTREDFTVGPRNENFEYMYRATKEGTYTIYAEDKYGNNYQETFTIDRTAAKLVSANMYSNGNKYTEDKNTVYYTTNGNTITAYIRVNEQLKEVPTITLTVGNTTYTATNVKEAFHNEADKANGIYRYQATVKVDEFNPVDGDVQFTVTNIKDKAGNDTANVTKVTNKNIVRIDRTAAARVYSTIRSKGTEVVHANGADRDYYHKNGTEFEYAISFTELLAEVPTVTIGGKEVEMKLNEKVLNNENKFLYEGTFKIAEDEKELPEGVLEINVTNVKDLAGNETTLADQTKTSNGRRVIYDRTAAKPVSTTYSPKTLTNGNVTVTIKVNEELKPVEGWTLSEDKKSISKEFANNTKGNVVIYDLAGNKATRYYKISNIDREAPKPVSTTYSPKTLTNGNVTVIIKVNEELKPVEGWTLSEDKKSISKEFTNNTKGSVVISDLAGNTVTRYYKISNIDRVAPEVTSTTYSSTTLTNENVTVTINVNEEIKPVEGWTLSEDKKSITKEFTKNTTGNVVITDLAGNTVTSYYEISNIDKEAPKAVSTTYSPKTLTNGNVTVTIKVNEELKPVEGWTLSEDKKSITKEFTKNASGSVVIYDLAGNKATRYYKVSNIDKVAPKVTSTTYSSTTLTNENVTVTINVNEEIKPVEGWTLSEDKKSITKEFTKNTTGNVVITDLAGNTVTTNYEISNIDKEAPKAVSTTYSPKTLTNGNVTVTIKVNEELKPVEGWTLSEDKKSITKEFTKNTTGSVVIYDLAGNKATRYYKVSNIDKEAAEIELPGQEGESKNQYRILKDSYIAVSYLKAKVFDNMDEDTTILPTKFYAYYPKATGIPSGVYNLEEGKYFDTSMVGVNYEVQYEYTDEAGNTTKKSMLLIVDAPYVPEIVDNVIDVKYDLTLNDKPFYNDKTRTEPLTINGNGKTITQEIDTDYKYTWDKSGTRPMQSNMFTSANNSLVTVNDLNFAGTMYSMTLGHYVSTYANQGKFTTILNNVNMINTKVASFSANTAPAMSIYGKATLNDVNVYGTTLSELDTDPMWPVYDIITLNYSDTTINRGKIGTIYTWGNARLEINGTEVDTITSAMRTGSGYGVNYGLIIGDNTKVNKIIMTSANASITVKSTAEIGTLDLCANEESGMYLNIEPGAKIGKVIVKNGDSCKEMTYDEWYKNITTSEKLFTAMALGGELKLATNLEVKQQLNIPTGVNVVLDMNGKTLTMADSFAKANKNYTVMINMLEGSALTIKGNGTIDLEDNYKDVFIIPRGDVTIENGNFLKDSNGDLKKYQSFFAGVKYGKGKMVIKDGYFDFGYYNEDSLYYNAANGLNLSYDQSIKIYGGTFVGQNPAYGDESSAATSPAVNLNHCQGTFFEGQKPTDTEIPSTYTVEEGTHADGRPTYKVTYTPAQ